MKKFGWLFVMCISCLPLVCVAGSDNHYEIKFKAAAMQTCDTVLAQIEDSCDDMICRDELIAAWANCWKKSMNATLDKRLLALKKKNTSEFQHEMQLQKTFNVATQAMCNKNCGDGNGMKGIPHNFCRAGAYQYRSAQATQINAKQLSVPLEKTLLPGRATKPKAKDTKFYNAFAQQICTLPKEVWQNGRIPTSCQKAVLQELDTFEFTDDVCSLA